jgi:hypothetical protein
MLNDWSELREGLEGRADRPHLFADLRTISQTQIMLAAIEDKSVSVAEVMEVFREALFQSELIRYQQLGVDLSSVAYIPQVSAMTEEYLEFFECQIHKHKLFATSIAKAKELTGHVVNRLYLQKVAHHYEEFNRFRPLLRATVSPLKLHLLLPRSPRATGPLKIWRCGS